MLSSTDGAMWISGGVLHVQPAIPALAPCVSGDWHCSLNDPRTMSGRRLREAVKRVSCWQDVSPECSLSGTSHFLILLFSPRLLPSGVMFHRCFLLTIASDLFCMCFLHAGETNILLIWNKPIEFQSIKPKQANSTGIQAQLMLAGVVSLVGRGSAT